MLLLHQLVYAVVTHHQSLRLSWLYQLVGAVLTL